MKTALAFVRTRFSDERSDERTGESERDPWEKTESTHAGDRPNVTFERRCHGADSRRPLPRARRRREKNDESRRARQPDQSSQACRCTSPAKRSRDDAEPEDVQDVRLEHAEPRRAW